jgi:hypothetical protein
MPGEHCLLAHRGPPAPIYWRSDVPCAINKCYNSQQAMRGIIEIFKKRRTEHFGAPHLFSGQSPINWGITNRKRKYSSEKTTATLKSKQTSIAMVGNHLRTVASLPTLLLFHYPLPLKGSSAQIRSAREFIWDRPIGREYLMDCRGPGFLSFV